MDSFSVCNAVMVEMLAINILPESFLIRILSSNSNSTILRVEPNPLSISPRYIIVSAFSSLCDYSCRALFFFFFSFFLLLLFPIKLLSMTIFNFWITFFPYYCITLYNSLIARSSTMQFLPIEMLRFSNIPSTAVLSDYVALIFSLIASNDLPNLINIAVAESINFFHSKSHLFSMHSMHTHTK